MSRYRAALGFVFVLPVLWLAGCNGSDSVAPSDAIEDATFAPALGVNLAASTKTTGGMYYRDIVVGTGPVIATGQTLSVAYTGWLANGTQFDSRSTSNPLPVQFGVGRVIEGWDIGLTGMRVGGQRQLIIPPSLGYGASGNGAIPGNAVLVFNVTIVSAR